MMEYKGCIAYVEFDDESEIFHGEVISTRDVITFQGESVSEIKQEFHKSVDVYADFCKRHGKEQDRPFSGNHLKILREYLDRISKCFYSHEQRRRQTDETDRQKI